MTTADAAWRDGLAALLRGAPGEFRELASDALHIGGFTNVCFEHPVLDLRGVADDARADRALANLSSSLGSPCQCITALSENKFFLISNLWGPLLSLRAVPA